jgi:hypothetical protein
VNSLLIAPFIGYLVPKHIGWSKQQRQLVKSKKILCGEQKQSIKNLKIFLVDSVDIVVSRLNVRATD